MRFVPLGFLLACAPDPVADPDAGLDGDGDGDGLSDVEEADLGTDPALADTDGDRYSDGEEVAAHADPLDPEHHPYRGGWPIGDCADAPEGPWDVGLVDQHGDRVRLRDFCDRTVYVVACPSYCAPCVVVGGKLEALYQEEARPAGVMIVQLLTDDEPELGWPDLLDAWVAEHGLTLPVLADPAAQLLLELAATAHQIKLPHGLVLAPGPILHDEGAHHPFADALAIAAE